MGVVGRSNVSERKKKMRDRDKGGYRKREYMLWGVKEKERDYNVCVMFSVNEYNTTIHHTLLHN